MDWQRLGDAIRRRRLALDLSQEELGRRSGVTPVTISRVENGHPAKIRTLWKLDRGLEWEPGSAESILHGGEPVEFDGGTVHPMPTPKVRMVDGVPMTEEEQADWQEMRATGAPPEAADAFVRILRRVRATSRDGATESGQEL